MTSAQVVWVSWLDSSTLTGWDAYERIKKLPETYTCGIMVDEVDDHYVIAHSFDPDSNEFNGIIRIPFAAVTKARTLCTIQLMTTKTK